MRSMAGRPLALILALALLSVDQASKALVSRLMAPGFHLPLVPGLPYPALTLVTNTGAAFGLLAGGQAILVPVTALILAILAWLLAGRALVMGRAGWAGIGLLLGGAAGNLLDRVRLGGVVDFVDLGFWPVFNLADVGVVAGALLLAWEWIGRREESRRQQRAG